MWVSKETFGSLFGDLPATDDIGFAALDRPMPHPIYGRQSWVSILNPTDATMPQVKALLTEAHARAIQRMARNTPTD